MRKTLMGQWGDKSGQEKMQTLSAKFQTVSGKLQLEAVKRKSQTVSGFSSFLAAESTREMILQAPSAKLGSKKSVTEAQMLTLADEEP